MFIANVRAMQMFALVALLVGALTTPLPAQAADAPAPAPAPAPAIGTSLLRFPDAKLGRDGATPPRGFWGGISAGQGAFHHLNQDGTIVHRQTSQGVARLQLGTTSVLDDALKPFWGSVVELSMEVRGRIDSLGPDGTGVATVVEFTGTGGAGTNFVMAPRTRLVNNRPVAEKTTGTLDWTPLRAVFRVPANTAKIAPLMYLMNAAGELEWRHIRMNVVDPKTPVTVQLNDFQTAEQAAAAIAARTQTAYDKRLGDIRARLKIPPASELYHIPADLASRRPRFYFNERVTPANLQQRLREPALARIADRVRLHADALIAHLPQMPRNPRLDVEDPLRGWADGISVQAVAVMTARDAQEKAKYLDGLTQWLETLMGYGVSPKNLPLAQTQLAFAVTYDWLHNDLSPELKARMRDYMLRMARRSFDMSNSEVSWVFATQYLANHNWFNYTGRLFTVLALWGENDPAINTDELRNWLDLSIENLWIIAQTHPHDGMPIEGFLYGDYGSRPYFDAAVTASSNLKLNFKTVEHDSMKLMGRRINALLPETAGFMVYGDSKPEQFSGGFYFRYVASKHRDPISQRLAAIMDSKVVPPGDFTAALFSPGRFTDINNWRSIFWHDPSVPEAELSNIPLHYDATDLGLYLSRSDWNDTGTKFFGLRCGAHSATSVIERFGVGLSSGHCYPEQGSFSFYVGKNDLIPGCDYARTKMTSNHSLVLFEGRDAQKSLWVGQVGEGGAWFDTGRVKVSHAQRQAAVTNIKRGRNFDQYLCDLGGVYALADTRTPGGTMFPDYQRQLTFLRQQGVVIVADRVTLPQPRTFKLRLLGGGKNPRADGQDLTMEFGPTKARMRTLLADGAKFEVSEEQLVTWGKNHRAVGSWTVTEAREATFIVAIGLESDVQAIKLKRDGDKLTLEAPDVEPLTIGW